MRRYLIGCMSFILRLAARRYIAGESLDEAISVSRSVQSRGAIPLVNYLGEELYDRAAIESSVKEYERLMGAMAEGGIRGEVAVKPTQIGLSVSYDLARENYSRLAKRARDLGIFLWLDMESYRYLEGTLKLYFSEVGNGGVGVAIQSYLRRSERDLMDIVRAKGVVRLVKGAYRESPEVAFQSWEERTSNYRRLMRYLFDEAERFTIATHDKSILREAFEMNAERKKDVTLAVLLGIRNSYLYSLVEKGAKGAIYIPYGELWLDYVRRRMREAANLALIIKTAFER